ncbi:PepSY domain-containing protein [Methylobacterium sp. J-076]|uniref:PepSY domain-containing protein n=1 Tax=Methylobacterium sp. J-076 TaxID=2836655 RepID=UPI001FBADEA7|nr:PepSY domain-containing protein [Methylobacterium sp. J-076]MCJ2011687.1 PepSY domain-containing protein [Methylobacterium sp. J-076]
MVRAAGKAGRRWLLLGHRWLGIGTGLLFALWIGSGLVMLYVPFPSLDRAERLARLAPIAWDRVRIGPDAALAAAGEAAGLALEMRDGEPVYRVTAAAGARRTVSAVTGELLGPVDAAQALRIAGGGEATAVRRDQWTVTARYNPQRPFWKVALGDPSGREVYVSARTGEVALVTTRWQRGWNWAGAVVHWVYLTPLRARPELWRQVVLWLSGVAGLTALSGLAVGLWRLRLRLRRRYRGGAVSPYRGLALWHHAFGLAGGFGLALFILSGWLSMNPNRWFSSLAPPAEMQAAYAGRPGALGLAPGDLERLAGPGLTLLRFTAIGGRWWLVREGAAGPVTTDLDGGAGPDAATLAAAATVPGGRLASVERITAYDAYWYPHGGAPPLPVLRLTYDDPAATWLHVDPRDGTILNRLDRSGRINRWLFDAPHRLDLPGLSVRPTAREAGQWALNLLGAGIAATGLVAGARRLIRR